jgi:hypothetical protein
MNVAGFVGKQGKTLGFLLASMGIVLVGVGDYFAINKLLYLRLFPSTDLHLYRCAVDLR